MIQIVKFFVKARLKTAGKNFERYERFLLKFFVRPFILQQGLSYVSATCFRPPTVPRDI